MSQKGKTITGDRFMLCTFPLTWKGQPLVLESGNDLGYVCSKIPDHIDGDDKISVCEVTGSRWEVSEWGDGDTNPIHWTLLYQVEHYDDPCEDEDDEVSDTQVNLHPVCVEDERPTLRPESAE